MPMTEPHPSKTEARQGDGHKTNLRVLLFSTVGVIALFAIIYLVFFAGAPAGA